MLKAPACRRQGYQGIRELGFGDRAIEGLGKNRYFVPNILITLPTGRQANPDTPIT